MSTQAQPTHDTATPRPRLPLGALLAFATVAFTGCVTETLPAGLLVWMSADLDVSPAQAGQLVTVYAISTALTSVPLTALTRRLPRRALLVSLIVGFAVVSAVTAVSSNYPLTLVARIVAGAVSGVMWAMIPGYAMRLVPAASAGRALAVAMVGTPVGFAVGVPAGTFLGDLVGWRAAFGVLVAITVALVGWVLWRVPALPGEQPAQRTAGGRLLAIPGFAAVLATTFGYVLGHNILYTYLGPVLAAHGRLGLLGTALLVFGVTSVLGIWLVGAVIDTRLRPLVLGCTAGFALAGTLIALAGGNPVLLCAATALWGLAFGGAPTLFPAAAARVAGRTTDLAQSLTITVWNIAIAAGAAIGGTILSGQWWPSGATALPWVAVALAALAFALATLARRAFAPAATGDR
ncbi:MFS transporter [Goodfellowiella coeruleoviolacea]|uniref:Arabinose efflux permease, MFS family n=1 Tax=Goodfellowiella coeruleoviolacea TaxID=334858 RepID=A0AAE3KK85_9PSEU|nr:MFS transporter [Goodfellowiella coeruleoviolacea]MCP2169114.1 putative arabinose efflux permease, MFS family [Goodfellowiella coeruleoviolacea]